jgi:hypothetical protein
LALRTPNDRFSDRSITTVPFLSSSRRRYGRYRMVDSRSEWSIEIF